MRAKGKVRVVDQTGQILLEQDVEPGDIFRMCQVKDAPIQDWVKLAVNRARLSHTPVVFWLDKNRGHDAEIIKKVERYLQDHDTKGLDIRILAPEDAAKFSHRPHSGGQGHDLATGNVLRDYLTDLFPILELGTSAKMLSIVPLMDGGGLFETGAGGSAPKHVQQFREEGYLRWDSLGEFLALGVALEHLSQVFNNKRAEVLADTLDQANAQDSSNITARPPAKSASSIIAAATSISRSIGRRRWPSRRRTRTFRRASSRSRRRLQRTKLKILAELAAAQGKPQDIGGYYRPDFEKASAAMRPSPTLNAALASLAQE